MFFYEALTFGFLILCSIFCLEMFKKKVIDILCMCVLFRIIYYLCVCVREIEKEGSHEKREIDRESIFVFSFSLWKYTCEKWKKKRFIIAQIIFYLFIHRDSSSLFFFSFSLTLSFVCVCWLFLPHPLPLIVKIAPHLTFYLSHRSTNGWPWEPYWTHM